jgi:hypothetical protein
MALGIVAILAGSFPAAPVDAEYFARSPAQLVAMGDRGVSADKELQGHKAYPACSPGLGCLAFIVIAEEALATAPFGAIIESVDTARLATRAVAPPLPPPKPVTLA